MALSNYEIHKRLPTFDSDWGPNVPGSGWHPFGGIDPRVQHKWNPNTGRMEFYDSRSGDLLSTAKHTAPNVLKKGLPIAMAMLGAGAGLTALGGHNPFPWAASKAGLTGGIGSNVPKAAAGGLWPMDAGMTATGPGLFSGLGTAAKKGLGALLPGSTAQGTGAVTNALGGLFGKPGFNEVLGGLLADSSLGYDSGGSTHTSGPWSALQPFVQDIYGQAQDLYGQGYESEYAAPLKDFAMQGLKTDKHNQLIGRLTGRTEYNPYLNNVVGQKRSNPFANLLAQDRRGNPYLDAMYGRAASRLGDQFSKNVLPGIHAAFSGAGATGDALHPMAIGEAATGYGRSLADLAANMYGQAYDRDMSRNLQGQMAAGSLFGQDLGRFMHRDITGANVYSQAQERMLRGDIAAGQYAGQDLQRNQDAQQFAANLALKREQMESPWHQLQQYANVVGAFPFTQSQSETDQGLTFSLG